MTGAIRALFACLLVGTLLAIAGCSGSSGSVAVDTGGGGVRWQQNHLVIDAEYDRAHDVIVTVSDLPYRLHVLDPATRTNRSVALSLAPICVSVRPDGLYAAVGHTGFISYVDLTTMTVERIYNVSCDVSDVVLPGNGWVYAFPVDHDWDQVRNIQLGTGSEANDFRGSVLGNSRARLHPAGSSIYAAAVGHQHRVMKFDIGSGPADSLYEKFYDSQNGFEGNLWLSDDGLRIFTQDGSVFRASEVFDQDMVPNGNLADGAGVHAMDTATAQNRVFVVPTPLDEDDPIPGEIRIYNYETLTLDSVVELPGFTVDDGSRGTVNYAAHGAYVFADSSGTAFHALYRADSSSGLLYDWAIATYDVNTGYEDGEPIAPELFISDQDITFDCATSTHTVTLSNPGTDALAWEASTADSRIGLSSNSGTLLAGGSQLLTITVQNPGRARADVSEIIFTTDTPQTKSIMVHVLGTGPCADAKWRQDHLIIDAEYDHIHDTIVTVSDAPYSLHVLDPNARTTASLPLTLAPTCVAVRPDGQYAAVGHDGYISYVNLGTMTVEHVYAVSCDVFDIVLPSNGWVYSVPRRDQWQRIRSTQLSNGNETLHTGNLINSGTKIKLHPSGNYIYGANNGLSPSDLEKYDIRGGATTYLYDSPYHGDFEFSGDLWTTDDGSRIFTRSGNVFRASEVREQDMIFNGQLSDGLGIHWMDASSSAGYAYVVPQPGDFGDPIPGTIHVYGYDYFTFEQAVELPTFSVSDGMGGSTEHAARGAFVFANSTGATFHVLYRADESSGLLYDWAIATYDIQTGFRLGKPVPPRLELSGNDLRFDCFTPSHRVTLSNPGTEAIDWQASAGDPHLTLSAVSDTLLPGTAQEIVVTLNRDFGGALPANSEISFTTSTKATASIAVHVANADTCDGVKWPVDHRVVDAEYDRVHDRIVTISDGPSSLHVLDPNSRISASVELPLASSCVSVRPDGLYAAAGHIGFVSYVNLSTMTVERIYTVSCDVFDLVLASNGWMYIVPRRDQHEDIRNINIASGAENIQFDGRIASGTKIKLHPSGSYLYNASPSLRVQKYDILSGAAQFRNAWSYDGNHRYDDDLWLSRDGLRIFTQDGGAHRSAETFEQDMLYNGHLADGTGVVSEDDAAGHVFTVPTPEQFEDPIPGEVRVYDADYLTRNRIVALPGFNVPDGDGGAIEHRAQGGYVFADSSGSTFHALYQAEPGAALPYSWTVATYGLAAGFRDGVTAVPRLTLSDHNITFQCFTKARQIIVSNTGTDMLEWEALADDPRVVLSSASGTLAPGAQEELLVSIDWDAPGAMGSLSEITFVTSALDVDTVAVRVVGTEACTEDKWSLDHLVIDAEYNRTRDVIVTVSEAPYRLNVLDPNTQTNTSVDLAAAPKCVSIRPDGLYAAVGHNGSFSYVNLLTLTVEQVYSVTCNVFDIVLPSNGWVYSMPQIDSIEEFRCTELATGNEILQLGGLSRERTRLKLHPSGDFIYGADNTVSPNDIMKYDIRPGRAVTLWDSRYHGDFDFGGDLWILDDGLRIFTRSGNVFSSSSTQNEDLLFVGHLSDPIGIKWMDASSAAGYAYVVQQPRLFGEPIPGEVRLYSYDFLTLDSVVELPSFSVPDGNGGSTEVAAQGAYVFADSTGGRFHALYHAAPGSGILLDWAVSTYSIAP